MGTFARPWDPVPGQVVGTGTIAIFMPWNSKIQDIGWTSNDHDGDYHTLIDYHSTYST